MIGSLWTDLAPPAQQKISGRVLFVPVSGPRGMGEYARTLALATAASQRWPRLEIHFALSRQAPYASDTPFPFTLLPSSPTFHSAEMAELIRVFHPRLVVFDNAGRTAQLRAASTSGARVIYISSRPRQRRKAFRVRWMRLVDEHWIAYPEFVAGALSPLEKLKMRMLGRPNVHFLDSILPAADPALAATMMRRYAVSPGNYVFVVPGGGTGHPGAENAPATVAEAARRIAACGYQTLLAGVKPAATTALLRSAPRMPMEQMAELIRGACLVISNGGDTMLQAIACGRPCVAVPIAGDQAHRIDRCERAGLVLGAKLDASEISKAAISLLEDEPRREAICARLACRAINGARVTNGMSAALATIERFVTSP